ncbi:MAG: prohibitin family protein [Pelatocladus maniniholoensis HA4357-MV3]|jgi:prohibitin 1|uniref:Prohibitin family protein n=1 Tax=Pelatocladus maniniholoensis HA4357-MV3 TaxID=1117104 RepID=A0A9E3LT54_9NOST|nr:prohibitin family protein [Pelatocladus maniniholoensis HA4357-MV3]BAZ66815.1 SPFH domain, Band 7 family protein [Fischerella sp. NIES-4106]
MKKITLMNSAGKFTAILFLITIILTPFVIINAGERGVLMEFGKVDQIVLDEGIHVIIPIVNTVKKISVRVQKQQIAAEAYAKDLQDVFTEVALNWHILPGEVNLIFQKIGTEKEVVEKIINPAVEEVLKAVIAKYTAEEVVTKRGEVKLGVDEALTKRLHDYYIAVDDISLVHVNFSDKFSEAVEAKQIAEQEAKRAEFIALKAVKQAEAQVNLAKGETEVNRLLHQSLTPEILERQAIEKWNGKLPLMVSGDTPRFLNISELLKISEQ